MLFDINTALGHWPFQRIPNATAADLRRLLAASGIGGAACVNTHGLFYKNCHDANLELAEWLAPHADFFVGVATLNPMYAAWERDLVACRETLDLRGLRLAPQYHDYRLGNGPSVAVARAAAALGLPIFVPERIQDVRQRHWLDTERTVGLDEVAALCRAAPEAKVILTESRFSARGLLDNDRKPLPPNLYLESSRTGIGDLPPAVAARHVVFGSGAPFKCITPALLKFEHAALTAAQRARVAGKTARALLGV